MKNTKGITLISLIITVVVLLILAVVAITLMQETDIIEHANNAATLYEQEQDKEAEALNGYEDVLNKHIPTSCLHGTTQTKTVPAEQNHEGYHYIITQCTECDEVIRSVREDCDTEQNGTYCSVCGKS